MKRRTLGATIGLTKMHLDIVKLYPYEFISSNDLMNSRFSKTNYNVSPRMAKARKWLNQLKSNGYKPMQKL